MTGQTKIKSRYVVIAAIAIVALFAFWRYINQYKPKPKAAQPLVNLTLNNPTTTVATGTPTTVTYVIQPTDSGNKISAVDLRFGVTGNLSIVSIDTPTNLANGDSSIFTETVKTVTATSARVSYVIIKPEADLPTAIAMNVTVQGSAEGSGQLTLDTVNSKVTGNIVGYRYDFGNVDQPTFTFTGGSNASPTPTTGVQPTPTGTISGQAPSCSVQYAFSNPQDPNSDVTFSPSSVTDNGGGIYPGMRIEVDNGFGGNWQVANTNCDYPYYGNTDWQTWTCTWSTSVNHTQGLHNVRMYVKDVSGINERYCFTSFTYGQTGGNPTPTTGVQPTPTTGTQPTPTQTQNAPMTLDLKLKFQGINSAPTPNLMKTRITITGGSLNPTQQNYSYVDFTSDAQGIWTGTLPVSWIPAGSNYEILVKGPHHLQKKICVNSPTETTPGTYNCAGGIGNVSLSLGTNTLNFSNILLLVGDLPDANGQQDGVVDSYDISYIRNNLGSTDPAKVAIGDLNEDGIIDVQDYSLLIQSLLVKYDDQ